SMPRIGSQPPAEAASRQSGVRMLQLASAARATAQAAAGTPAQAPPADSPLRMAAAPAGTGTAARANGYAVQLGAYGTQAGADRAWQRLQTRFGAQLSGLSARVVTADTATGQLYRLQAPAAGEAQARAICDSLKQQSQACVPVAPH
ncbi:MAG: SPOR domain-containing protein, partial [Steroidobacteraceae bacterium]